MKNWCIFIQERFPPLKHVPLILFFFLANTFVFNGSFLFLSFFIVLLAFFHLRVFDEIKDYKNDLALHPERPLARGLISIREAKRVVFFLLCVELGGSLWIGFAPFLAALFFILYSLLMYKEFFVGSWLRLKLATYALTHTIISCFLSLFIFSSVTHQNFWEIPKSFAFFVLSNWMVFNIFEFGRKTFGKEEEKPCIESYSKNFGAYGAAFCVLGFAAFAVLGNPLSFFLWIPLSIVSLLYGHFNTALWAKRFRLACSLYILFYYMIISLRFFL